MNTANSALLPLLAESSAMPAVKDVPGSTGVAVQQNESGSTAASRVEALPAIVQPWGSRHKVLYPTMPLRLHQQALQHTCRPATTGVCGF